MSSSFSLPRILQAPMAGGPTTVDLVVAVSDAGALGNFGAAYLTPQQIRDAIEATRERTRQPFGINLFVPLPEQAGFDAAASLARLRVYYEELGLPVPLPPQMPSQTQTFAEQLDVLVAERVPVFSFTFGIPAAEQMARVKASGAFIIGTATTVDEAIALEVAGCNAIAAQGSEAGGHRGTFAVPAERALIGTMALVPQIVDAVRVPVIASGGIMDGRGIAAALALGAVSAQLGTAFLATPESGAPAAHKAALLEAHDDATAITRAFSGRAARGIVNRVMRELGDDSGTIAPYPVQNALTRAMRAAAAKAGKSEYLSLWSGQAPRLARTLPAAELVRTLERETREAIARLGKLDAV
jgi:nitronate monooxygenase